MKTRALWFRIAIWILPFVAIESGLRVAGYPKDLFYFEMQKSSTRTVDFGVVPYVVTTNSLGYRGGELASASDPAIARIIAVGDSVTQGFYVDDADTYPAALQRSLIDSGVAAEVLNTGWGGISIGKEYAIARATASLEPDIVLLTFTTNDISDLLGRERQDLITTSASSLTLSERVFKFLAETATGEVAFDAVFDWIFESYGVSREEITPEGDDRYDILGGLDFRANARTFDSRYADMDGAVVTDVFSLETQELVDTYGVVVDHMATFLANRDVGFVLVYYPAYSQIYEPETSMRMRDVLREVAARNGAGFLDLTPVFQGADRAEALHLAPLDFHPNPAGNRLMGRAVADYFIEAGWLLSATPALAPPL